MATLSRRICHVTICLLATRGHALAEDRTIQLFDGTTFKGWTDAEGKPVGRGWAIEDGMLARNGGGGSIFTAQEYRDFDLSFEWKIAERGNSGVKYRVTHYKKGVHGNPGWLGCEYQLYDDVGRRPRPKFSTGAIYELYAPSSDKPLRPIGEFNQSRIVARGNHLEHWLNGVRIVSAETGTEDWNKRIAASKFGVVDDFFKNHQGRIELQDHGSKVWFRHLVLKPLDAE